MFSLFVLCAAEIYSDIMISDDFQTKALKSRHEQFWTAIEKSASTGDYVEATQTLFECVQELPEWGDDKVKALLNEALAHLYQAAQQVSKQNDAATDVALQAIADGPTGKVKDRGFFATLYSSFVADSRQGASGANDKNLRGQVSDRQRRVASFLKGSTKMDVLTHTRLASKQAFLAMKWDLYAGHGIDGYSPTKVPATPQAAKDIADKIVELQDQVRHAFLGVITTTALTLADDASGSLGRVVVPAALALPEATLGLPDNALRV